jgi:glycosyltransferase involved in cell wall biosynthesis
VTASIPKVTVGVPVYNGQRYLGSALEALLAQDFVDIEVIVADNASTDDSLEIARSFAEKDRRVSVHPSETNRGAAWNFNRTLDLATGRWFKWAACDDLCAPSFIRRCVETFEDGPASMVLAYPKTTIIDEDGQPVREFEDGFDLRERTPHERLAHLLAVRTDYHPVFGLIRTDALKRTRAIGGYVGSDVALLVELCLMGQFYEVPDRLFLRRIHPGTSVLANPGANERAEWFDPVGRGGARFPFTRLTGEFVRIVADADLTMGEKLRCETAVARRWAVPYARAMGGELKAALRQVARASR